MLISDVLNDESKWAKGTFCTNKQNGQVLRFHIYLTDPSECTYCLQGAAMRSGHFDSETFYRDMNAVIRDLYPQYAIPLTGPITNLITVFNDSPATTYEMVMAVVQEYEKRLAARQEKLYRELLS